MNQNWTEETALYALTMTYLEEPSKEVEVIEGEVEEVAPPPFYKRPISRTWALVLGSCLLVVSTIAATVLIMFFSATATVDITLARRPVSFQQTMTLPATQVFTTTKMLSQTAKATGAGHQDAMYAHGVVTLYNALPAPQEVSQGQLLIGSDGVHIVTDADALLPAGTLSVNGQTTVPAHVTTVGSQGNIAAGDVSGPCCRDYIFARNAQFSGGQDARDFSIVAQQDIDGLTQSLAFHIDQRIQQDFAAQLLPTDTLTPNLCSQNVAVAPPVGQEATTVTVSISKTCSAASYRQTDVMNQVQTYVSQFVGMKFGGSYIPVGTPQVRIRSISLKENTVKISALVNGTMIYHFRKADMDTLKRLIAGKTKEQAGQIILKWGNLQLTGIQLQFNQGSLPNDPERITVRVKP